MIIHELYGLQAEELETLRGEYSKLLSLVQRVKDGEVAAESIEITDNSWKLNGSGNHPADDEK
jgi:hypothetical protein